MIFGRKKKRNLDEDVVVDDVATLDADADEDDFEDEEPEALANDELDEAELDELDDDEADLDEDEELDDEDELDELDNEDEPEDEDDEIEVDHDLREDGPFDLSEVDLDADDIERLDFGCLILTPFENMQVQLQVDQATNAVQSALVMADQSALEVALFAAPARSSMIQDVAEDMVTATSAAGGEAELNEGPFGPEIRRVIPVEGPEGDQAYHVSRTWFAQGPRWLLRGVLMGDAALQEGFEGSGELLFEFFCNVVVRRGDDPRVPGDLIPMSLPEGLIAPSES